MWNLKQKQKTKIDNKANKTNMQNRVALVPEGERLGVRNGQRRGGQLYGDGWKLNFGIEHIVMYTEVEISI